MKKLCLLIGLLVNTVAAAGSAIEVQQMSPHSYQLTYRSNVSVSVEDAQQSLYRAAVEVCAGREPVYGRYKYRQTGSVSTRVPGKQESYIFRQEIRCTGMR